jgi:trans-2,3-dihydro-3-hydroxyanthranilate isomerase
MTYKFYTADVFTNTVFGGAQIAVIPEADGLDDKTMQLLAREFNLSETVFGLPATTQGCDYKLRIFSPTREVDFAGHALIASSFILARTGCLRLNGTRSPFKLELNDSLIHVNVDRDDNNEPYFVQFSTSVKPHIDKYVPEREELAEILSLHPNELGCKKYRVLLSIANSNYLMVPVQRLGCVRNAVFDLKAWSRSSAPAMMAQRIFLFTNKTENKQANFHARLLGPDIGVQEDLPLGAAIPAFTAYLCEHKHIARGTHTYVAERGLAATRQSLLSVEMDNKGHETITFRVGGPAVMASSGTINI